MIKFWSKFRSKSFDTALLELIVSYRPRPGFLHENTSPGVFRHMNNSISMHLFTNSELQPGKSKEFDNQMIRVQFKRPFKSFFLLKPVYTTMVGEIFHIYGIKVTGKYICDSKNLLILNISPSKILPQVLTTTPQANFPFPRGSVFWKLIFHQQTEEDEANYNRAEKK